jgi:dihydroflavonol-4-reductase
MQRPLVIGGTGFIGFNIIHALLERGLPVRATRRETSIALLLRKLKTVEKAQVELDDPASIEAAMTGCDTVFMAAAHYPRYSVDADAQIEAGLRRTRNVLEAAGRCGVGRVVYTSSVTTVGPPAEEAGRPADETDTWARPPEDSLYFRLKLALEAEVLSRRDADGPEVVVTCPTGCLGEYGYKSGTGFFFVGLARREIPYLVDGPINIVDVRDAARAHVEAALRGAPGERYILGANNTTTRELLSLAAERLGVPLPSQEKSMAQAREENLALEEACAARESGRPVIPVEFLDMMRYGRAYDSGKAVRELGLGQTPLPEIVDRTIAWYRANGFLPKK